MYNLLISLIILIILINYNLYVFKEHFTYKNKNKNIKNIKIGIIIPVTSNKRNYKNITEIDFFKIVLPSFLKNCAYKKYIYNFYLGYDDDDKFFLENKNKIKEHFNNLTKMYHSDIKLYKIKDKKGKVGEIWSILAQNAVNDNCEYLYQIGDDIEFKTSGWEDQFIHKLKKTNNVGVVGPTDINNTNLLTQSFVHKTHLEIFTTYYPKIIENWYIDDWISDVYKPNYYYMFNNIKVINKGGPPRYTINKTIKNDLDILVKNNKKYLTKYLQKNKLL